jgi:uncharacterized short protein YbdD (DUF466 family)
MSRLLIVWNRARVRAAAVLRQVVGAPDYQRYVAHIQHHHPSTQPMAWDEFYRARLDERYNKPGARCC